MSKHGYVATSTEEMESGYALSAVNSICEEAKCGNIKTLFHGWRGLKTYDKLRSQSLGHLEAEKLMQEEERKLHEL